MQLRSFIIAGLLLFSTTSFSTDYNEIKPVTPSPNVTPGELCSDEDPDFTEYRYKEQIPYCERNVSSNTKTKIYLVYQVPEANRENYTIDHFVPLALGGNNADTNLWPEHKEIKALRRNLEMDLYLRIDRGQITQKEAVDIIVEAKMHPPLPITLLQNIFYQQ